MVKWYQKAVRKRRTPTGWRKTASQRERVSKMVESHRYKRQPYLSSAKALTALANVTKDPETKVKARRDSRLLYQMHKEEKR